MPEGVAHDEAELVATLRRRAVGSVSANAPLAPLTTLRVGGPAAALIRAEGLGDLRVVAEVCARSGRPWLVVGRGSNLLIADRGWPGVAIMLGRAFRGVQLDGGTVVAGAAEPMPGLARQCASAGLDGLAFGIAIPGTLGGAVRMNAGAHGAEMRDVLQWAEVCRLEAAGKLERWEAAELELGYRRSALPPDGVVVRAGLHLEAGEHQQVQAAMAEMRGWRREHQPLHEPSCGSVFRNPPGDSAGRLIEVAGLKGHRIGGAQVSPKHANFITAVGGTAQDVYQLIGHVQRVVAERCGVELRTEVVMVGFAGQPDDPGGPE